MNELALYPYGHLVFYDMIRWQSSDLLRQPGAAGRFCNINVSMCEVQQRHWRVGINRASLNAGEKQQRDKLLKGINSGAI